MKKIILAILCVVLTVALFAACGRENVGDYTEQPTTDNTRATTVQSTTTKTTVNNTTGVLTPTTGGATTQGSTTGANR